MLRGDNGSDVCVGHSRGEDRKSDAVGTLSQLYLRIFPTEQTDCNQHFFFSTHQLAISPLCLNSFASLMTTSLVTSEGRQAARH